MSIIDNRDMTNPNNKVLILCERASNDLKMTKLTHLENQFANSHDAFDPGAADLSNYISERTKAIAFHSNFSRLIVDPSKSLLSNDLVPLTYQDGSFVSFNKDGYSLDERLSSFYLNYHKILTEMVWFLDPKLIVSIKSH